MSFLLNVNQLLSLASLMAVAGPVLFALVAMAALHHLKLARQLREQFAAQQSLSIELRKHIRDEVGEITHFVGVKENIPERKQLQEKEQMSNYDKLTGLPNRALFFDRLRCVEALSRREGGGLALLYIDLDGFKEVNHSYGQEAGDAVLRTVAERLVACIRDSDTAARMGGDEFMVLLGNVLQGNHAGPIAQKVLRALSAPITLPDGIHCAIGVSIGISLYPEDGLSSEMLVNAADSAMSEVKREGQGGYRFYGETQSLANPGRAALTLCRNRG